MTMGTDVFARVIRNASSGASSFAFASVPLTTFPVNAGKKAGASGVPAGKKTQSAGVGDDATKPVNNEVTQVKNANTNNGSYWSKQASDLVARNLVRDVVGSDLDEVKGAHLTTEQTPNGTHSSGVVTEGAEPVKGAQLTKEQTPNQAARFNSGIVEKSQATKTEATKLANEGDLAVEPQPAVVDAEGNPVAPAPVAPEYPVVGQPAGEEAEGAHDESMEGEHDEAAEGHHAEEDAAAVAEAGIAQNPMAAPMVEACGIKMTASSMGYGIVLTAQDEIDLAALFTY